MILVDGEQACARLRRSATARLTRTPAQPLSAAGLQTFTYLAVG